jgi:hypothetical protein
MLAIFTNTSYDFIGKRRWVYAVSVAVMLLRLGPILVKSGLPGPWTSTGRRGPTAAGGTAPDLDAQIARDLRQPPGP